MTSTMKPPSAASSPTNPTEGEKQRSINAELWHACAGPLVSLPPAGTLVVYFPQGHLEQIAASMHRDADSPLPNYPNLPSKLVCLLHNVTLHADAETDEVFARMTLQPVGSYDKDALLATELAGRSTRPQPEFFCKTLTASDTSTHGGFSVPRRAAEKIFPALDFSMQPPAQELQARDLHDNLWTFRHIYRGQPKRHLLTTGWSLFVSGKRLFAGDSVLFIRDAKSQLLLGIRRANRQPTNISSSVLSSDSMHIGVLAAAAHAAANNSPFTVFYNPRASPSEFVIPLTKYNKAIYSNQLSLGMRFRMMFETEDSGTRRYMGTITGISDLDNVRWKNSQWRNLQVGWDESAAGERRNRVSIWEIEPVVAPFFICPPPFFRSKRPRQPGMPDDESDMENLIKRAMPWLGEEVCIKDSQTQNAIMPGLSLAQWMSMQQNLSFGSSSSQSDYLRSLTAPALQNLSCTDPSRQLNLQAQIMQQNNLQLNTPKPPSLQIPQIDQLSKLQVPSNQLSAIAKQPQQLPDVSMLQKQIGVISQSMPTNQNQTNLSQTPVLVQNHVQQPQQPQQQQPLIQTSSQPSQSNVPPVPNQLQLPPLQQQQILLQQQQQLLQQQLQQNQTPIQNSQQVNQQTQFSDQHIQLQLLQKLQLQQQAFLQQQMVPDRDQPKPSVSSAPQNFPIAQQLPQQHSIPTQLSTTAAPATAAELQFSQPLLPQQTQMQQKPQVQPLPSSELHSVILPPPTNLTPLSGGTCPSQGMAAQALDADALPSCSAPALPKLSNALPHQLVQNKAPQNGPLKADDISQSVLNPSNLDAMAASLKAFKESMKPDKRVKQLAVIPKPQSTGMGLEPSNKQQQQPYTSHAVAQTVYLDSSSSATSACVSQDDGKFQPSFPVSPLNQETMLFRDNPLDVEVQAVDPRNNVLFGVNIDGPLDLPLTTDVLIDKNINPLKDFQNNLTSADIVGITSKEAQQEMSSSIVSHSFGEPPFNSMDSNINDNGFLNKWPPPQVQRMRTYTKVYKRGAVGRSIDISRYSGYDELKQDLARMFSIEGQLEDRHKIGWKFVYVDHENDVLLVGDDPWEEFVGCVKCIRILSPQEVQQMSLEGEFGNNVLTNQNSSSSDGGNVWRGQCDQISGNPSAGSYDRFE